MKEIYHLIRPRLWAVRNNFRRIRFSGKGLRIYALAAFGLFFWFSIFFLFYRTLAHFKRVEGFGDILAWKLLSMVLLTFFAVLIMSSLINMVAKLYLSKDLELIHSLPIRPEKICLARSLEVAVDSSWMVVIYSVPILLSYGIIFTAGWVFYFVAGMTLLLLSCAAVAISSLVVLLAALILPAARLRTAAILLGVFLFILLVFSLRLMRPEQLVNPESFLTVIQYLKIIEAESHPYLPSTWAYDAMKAALSPAGGRYLFHLALLISFVGSLSFISYWLAAAVYFPGFSRSLNASRLVFSRRDYRGCWADLLSGPKRALVTKEIKTLARDQTQWPQLFLIVALIGVYIYNFSVLPLGQVPWRTTHLRNLISFLNIGLAAFVLTALAARFVYPSVSAEGQAFWLIRAAPVSIRTFIFIKYLVFCVPFVLLAEILIIWTNIILEVTTMMMILSSATIFLVVPGIVALALGLGSAHPDFRSENPSQTATSFGGLIYMMLSAGFIAVVIVLEAGPVYQVFQAELRGSGLSLRSWLWLFCSFALVIFLSVLAVWLPLRYGERHLTRLARER